MTEAGRAEAGLTAPAARAAAGWTLGGLLALGAALFWPSISGLAELWSHPERRTYQHGYLIAVISLWLLYRERHRWSAAAGRVRWAWIVAAAAGAVCWAVAFNAGLQAAHFLIWPAVLWAAASGALGGTAPRVLLRPFAFFYFALPMWDALNPGLQAATVLANEALATLLGVPVVIEDTLIHIPEGSFEIAGGCSGLNYLVVGISVAALLGEVNRDTPRRRLFLLALGAAMAISSNWLRVFIIIYAGHASHMTHYLVRVDHYKWGWVLYAFVLALFFLIARRLPPSRPSPAEPQDRVRTGWRPAPAAVAAACVALALGPLLAGRSAGTDAAWIASGGIDAADIAFSSHPWAAQPALSGWVPVFPGADVEQLLEFTRDGDRVLVYTATYLRQSQGRELVGYDSRVQGTEAGRLRIGGRQSVGDGRLAVREAQWNDAHDRRSLLWWIYQVDGRTFAAGLPTQLWYGLSSLWSRPVSSVVALRADCDPDCDAARQRLGGFAGEALPQLLVVAGGTGTRTSSTDGNRDP